MTAIGRILERAAAAGAWAVLDWTAGRLDASGREWLDVRGEVDSVEVGWAQLAWSVGGLQLVWEFEGRRRVSEALGKSGIGIVLVLCAGVALVGARLIGIFMGMLLVSGLLLTVGMATIRSRASRRSDRVTMTHVPLLRIPSARPRIPRPPLRQPASIRQRTFWRSETTTTTAVHASRPSPTTPKPSTSTPSLPPQPRLHPYAAAGLRGCAARSRPCNRLRPEYVNALMNRGDIYNYYYGIDRQRAIADYDRVIALGEASGASVCGHRMLAFNTAGMLGWPLAC